LSCSFFVDSQFRSEGVRTLETGNPRFVKEIGADAET